MHHEYYGHGYSILRAFIHKQVKENKEINPTWLISSNSEDIERLESLAFLQAKVLEIIDLYDTIVIPQKNYDRNVLEPKEVIKLIYKNYIKDDTQIDPILFDLFINFLKDIKKENIINPFDEQ